MPNMDLKVDQHRGCKAGGVMGGSFRKLGLLYKGSIRVPLRVPIRIYGFRVWEFPKIGGALFWRPYNKEPTI